MCNAPFPWQDSWRALADYVLEGASGFLKRYLQNYNTGCFWIFVLDKVASDWVKGRAEAPAKIPLLRGVPSAVEARWLPGSAPHPAHPSNHQKAAGRRRSTERPALRCTDGFGVLCLWWNTNNGALSQRLSLTVTAGKWLPFVTLFKRSTKVIYHASTWSCDNSVVLWH